MDDSPKSLVGARLASAKSESYLDQLGQELARYGELLSSLEVRLNPISERSPSESTNDSTTDRIHIQTMVHVLRQHNHDLDRIINEIAL